MPCPRFLALLALTALVAAPAWSQTERIGSQTRVLFTSTDTIKDNDGVYRQITTTLTYEPVRGAYVQTVTDASGALLSSDERSVSVAAPTPAEAAAAVQLVADHPEIATLTAGASGPVTIEGGFPLVREEGHPCGPGGRCALYDVWETVDGSLERIRFVIVDLRNVRVLDADADPQADTNLANPAARRQSRL
ncbi:MAG: hypothetical protein AAGK21_10925 [Bacteroidota bacterium]